MHDIVAKRCNRKAIGRLGRRGITISLNTLPRQAEAFQLPFS